MWYGKEIDLGCVGGFELLYLTGKLSHGEVRDKRGFNHYITDVGISKLTQKVTRLHKMWVYSWSGRHSIV